MITAIRRQLKSTMVKYALWFIFLVLGLYFVLPNLFQQESVQPWVARINDSTIAYSTFAQNVFKQEQNVQSLRAEYGDAIIRMLGASFDPKELALDQVVREAILNKVAKDIPLYIDADYLRQKFNDAAFMRYSGLYDILPMGFFGPEGLNEDALRYYLSRIQMNMVQFEQMAEQALARYFVMELAGTVGAVTPRYLVQDEIERASYGRSYAVLSFNLDDIVRQERNGSYTDEALKAFFDKHNAINKRYWAPEKRSGSVWTFDPASYGISINEQDVAEYYDRNKVRLYVDQPATTQVRRILFKVSEDEPKEVTAQQASAVHAALSADPSLFEQKAKEVSEDEASASKGGLLPAFKKGERSPAFERAAFMLKNDGDISQIIATEDGLEILQRVNRTRATYTPLEKVRDNIEQELVKQAFAKQFPKDVRALSRTPNADEIEQFAQKHGGTLSTIALSAKDSSAPMRTLFNLKEGGVDTFMENGNGYLVRLDQVQKRALPAFDEVKELVKEDLAQERAQEKLKELVQSAKDALTQKAPSAVAQELNAELYETGVLYPKNEQDVKKVQDKGLSAEKMFQLVKRGSSLTSLEGNKGLVYYLIDSIAGEQSVSEQEQKELVKEVKGQRNRLFAQGFIASLLRNATIDINKSLFNLN